MSERVRLVGLNHVALEVGDLEAALAFYGRLFEFELRGRGPRMAFIDIGDQFIALSEGRTQPPDHSRHLGLVVDDREAARAALAGGSRICRELVRLSRPLGQSVQVVEYSEIQFTKAPAVLRGMGLEGLSKTAGALHELRTKGLVEG